MMIRKFLLLFCLFLILPVLADEQKTAGNPFDFIQESLPVEDYSDSIFLFEPGIYDNNPKPYSIYMGNNFSNLLKGGVQINETPIKPSPKDNDLIFKPKHKKDGKLYIGNLPAGSLTRGVKGGYSLYQKDKFGFRSEYLKNSYKEEFERNSIIMSPEYYVNKNVTLRAFHGETTGRKGFEEGLALEYALNNKKIKSKKIKNLRFEVSASKATGAKNDSSQRFGFNTRYNF